MKKGIGKFVFLAAATLFVSVSLGGCGGGGSGNASTGTVSVGVTDAPNTSFQHVWITVKEVWFHTSNVAGTNDPGWLKYPLKDAGGNPTAVTVDLAALANGAAPSTIWNGSITLPVGTYQQIRIFLADTDNETLTNFNLPGFSYNGASYTVKYNNEVDYLDSSNTFQQAPLEIPSSDDGISVIPETPIVVTATSNNKLVLDFNTEDVVGPITPKGTPEFILKPRLKYFDMSQAGTITGVISSSSGYNFVVKAEKLYNNPSNSADPNNGQFFVVRRATGLAGQGQFSLFPVAAGTYDILLRGRNVQTYVIQQVTVAAGATTNLGTINMASGSEYTAQLQTAYHPTGAWINFYQSVDGSKPYEVRFRHLDPYVGKFYQSIPLSTGQVNLATWQNVTPIAFTAYNPDQGLGTFWTAPGAEQYARVTPSVACTVSGAAGQTSDSLFTPATLTAAPTSDSITAAFMLPSRMSNFLPISGQLFVTHGGLIIDGIGTLTGDTTIGTAMHNGGGAGNVVTIGNLPGGSTAGSLPGAFYGLYAAGWGGGRITLGAAHGIDLRNGSQGTSNSPVQITMH